jgi:tetratricopeptide (TPR) repeat protein
MRCLILILGMITAFSTDAKPRDMSRYSEVQHSVFPAGVSSRSRVERVPLQAAFDLIIPGANFGTLNKLQKRRPALVDRINEIPQGKREPRRYRYAVKIYNFDVWSMYNGGRFHLYIARDRAPYGGGIEVPMMPYYPEVEVPELLVGEPAYFPLNARKERDEILQRGEKLKDKQAKTQQTAFALQVFRAAQEYNAALEFLDQPELEEAQLKAMSQRAQRAVLLFGNHPASYDAKHLISEIVFETAAIDGEWDQAISNLMERVKEVPRTMDPNRQLRFQRAIYRLGRAHYDRNRPGDLDSAARRFKQAGRVWTKNTKPKLENQLVVLSEKGGDDFAHGSAALDAAKEIAAAAEVAELETRIQLDKSTKQESLIRKFLTLRGNLADVARYRLGTRLYALRRYELAAPLLAEAYKQSSTMAHEQPAMAMIVAESIRILGDEKASQRLIERLLESDPQGRGGSVAGRFDEDASAYAFALVRLGDLVWKGGDRERAKTLYSRAVRDFAKTEGGFLARIRLVEVTGEVQAEDFPLEVFRRLQSKVSRLSESSAEESMYREARARFLRGDYALAHEKLLQIEDQFPGSFLLAQDSGLLDRTRLSLMEGYSNRGEYGEVVEAFVLAGDKIDQSPVGARTLYLGGRALRQMGLLRQAIKAFQRALATVEVRNDGKQEEQVLVELSNAYLENLDLFRARQTLEYQAALFPKGKHIGAMWLLRGQVEEVAKRPDRAISAYREAVSLLKEDLQKAQALLRIGRLESARGAPASAAAAYGRAIERFDAVAAEKTIDGHVDAFFEMGDAFYRLRNWRQAARAYDLGSSKAVPEDGRKTMAKFRIGEIRAILGDLAGALQDWKVLAAEGEGLWQTMAAGAVEDLTWRLRHDGLLSERR